MPAATRAPKRSEKPAARTANPKKGGRPAQPPDYDDEITREQIEALNRIAPDDDFAEFKTVSGPAW